MSYILCWDVIIASLYRYFVFIFLVNHKETSTHSMILVDTSCAIVLSSICFS